MKTVLKTLLLLLLLAGAYGFVTANGAPVQLGFFQARSGAHPLWFWLGASFALGAAAAGAAFGAQFFAMRMEARRRRKHAAALESELHKLRNQPLESGDADAALPPGT